MICGVLIFFAVIFIWIVQNIGLPIKTQVEKGRIKVIDISSYNGTVNWKKVKDHNVNHAMIKIGSGMNEKRAGKGITAEEYKEITGEEYEASEE